MSAQKKKKKRQINLLPQEEFAASTLGRTLKWILSTFRIIVITTEMIVMTAFLSRFYFDAKLTDLNDVVKQKQAIIEAFSQIENDFRDVQQRLKIFSETTTQDKQLTALMGEISSALPNGVFLESVDINEGEINVTGKSPSELLISQFVANVDAISLGDLSITQVNQKESDLSLLSFSIKINQ